VPIVLSKNTEKVVIWRKIVHLSGGSVFPLIYLLFSKNSALISLSVGLAFFIILDYSRLNNIKFNTWFIRHFHLILKQKEHNKIISTFAYFSSAILVVVLFNRSIAIAALFFCAIGDAAAAIIGSRLGKLVISQGKTLEGSAAFFIFNLLIGILLLQIDSAFTWPILISGVAAATLAEALPVPIDDNYRIGLFSAVVMSLVSWIG